MSNLIKRIPMNIKWRDKDKELAERFLSTVRDERAKAGKTWIEIAAIAGIGMTRVDKFSRSGLMSHMVTVLRIADALNCDVAFLKRPGPDPQLEDLPEAQQRYFTYRKYQNENHRKRIQRKRVNEYRATQRNNDFLASGDDSE